MFLTLMRRIQTSTLRRTSKKKNGTGVNLTIDDAVPISLRRDIRRRRPTSPVCHVLVRVDILQLQIRRHYTPWAPRRTREVMPHARLGRLTISCE
jgi:hypothetical protein